jgi:chitosanase
MPTNSVDTRKIKSIVNVFETGTPDGVYHAISIYKDGPVINGASTYQITYGKSQTTEFGNLKKLIQLYISKQGVYRDFFTPYVSRIGRQPTLKSDTQFKSYLKKAALEDPIMRICQDEFFDTIYFNPACDWAKTNGFKTSLSLLVIYDSFIHSGGILPFLRRRFPATTPSNKGTESEWISQYVQARQDWLANHSNTILRKTTYRTKLFLDLIKQSNWELDGTIKVNGVKVS